MLLLEGSGKETLELEKSNVMLIISPAHTSTSAASGQSDIKKLRKENELLKKEIWNLRDEYCKLEDLLKKQQNIREHSEELENCSENEDGDEYSDEYEDDEEGDESEEEASESDELEEGKIKEESVENAENQKISTEVLGNNVTSSTVRARPNFDNLPSVNEEDESTIVEDKVVNADPREQRSISTAQPASISSATMTQSKNFPYYTTSFDQAVPLTTTSFGYQSDCPFIFPTLGDARGYSNIIAADRNCLPMTCPQTFSDGTSFSINPQTILATASQLESNVEISSQSSAFPSVVSTATPPIGWQSNANRENPITLPNFSLLTNTTEDMSLNAKNEILLRSNLHSNFDDTEKKISYDSNISNPAQNLINFTSSSSSIVQNSNLAIDINNMQLIDKKPPTAVRPKQLFSPLATKWKLPKKHNYSTDSFDDVLKIEQGDAKPFFSSENVSTTKDKLTISPEHRTRLTKSKSCDLFKSYTPFCENVDFSKNKRCKSDSILHNIFRKLKTKSLNRIDRSVKESKSSSPNTPDVKLPLIDYKFLNNPFLQNFEQAYQNFPLRTGGQSPIIHPLSIQISESPVPTSGYSSPVRMQPSFTGPNMVDQDCNVCRRKGLEPLRLTTSPTKNIDRSTEYQVTSFETPSPHTMRIPPLTPYEIDALRRMPTGTSPLPHNSKLYQNMPFEPRGAAVYYPGQGMRMYYDTVGMKVPVQTQTSPDDQVLIQVDIEPKTQDTSQENAKTEPDQPKKRRSRREKSGSIKEKKRSIKRKESSKKRSSCTPESSIGKSRNFEGQDDKRESRSSSSGQESPKKEHTKRVSLYVSTKKRPSLSSRTSRSYSVENERERSLAMRDETFDGNAMNSEIRKINSISNRESTSGEKARRGSTTSGNVPWCACWGNGCC
ncbi:uncharacterized protein LOC106659384 isoform X2 [Trichogramma pretiosum]|uniref:uncharacterized protein LOC106659384 isoform X2 n=1 Tax=Trichogramma pretiosum TaxID=7493 RepID=UPI0006C9DEDE|nr:uncharacterized protein LOC106659384 isoform X2 [Trichogramma pretiosum]